MRDKVFEQEMGICPAVHEFHFDGIAIIETPSRCNKGESMVSTQEMVKIVLLGKEFHFIFTKV